MTRDLINGIRNGPEIREGCTFSKRFVSATDENILIDTLVELYKEHEGVNFYKVYVTSKVYDHIHDTLELEGYTSIRDAQLTRDYQVKKITKELIELGYIKR